ncbi:PHD finger protein 3 [Mortierella sp. AD011]|nr:PHD finger protein 3 [Mortierella sp. AD011]
MADSTPQPEYYLHLDLTEGELESQPHADGGEAFLDFSEPSHEEAAHQDITEQDNQWQTSGVKTVLDETVSVAGESLANSAGEFGGLLGTQVVMDANATHWDGPHQVYGSLMDMELNKLSPPEQVSGCITPDLIFPSSLQSSTPIEENSGQEKAEAALEQSQSTIPESVITPSTSMKQAPSGTSKKVAAIPPADIRRSTRARRQSSIAAQSEEYLLNAQGSAPNVAPVPVERVTRSKKVYCYCQKPDDGEVMIQCDNCRQWFHGACVDITDEIAELMGLKNEKFFCDPCTEKLKVRAKSHPGKGLRGSRLSDARDCALPTCLNEARATSDYCSEECAIKGIELEASQAVKKEHRPSAIVIPSTKALVSHSAKKLSSPVQPTSPAQLKSPSSPKPEQNPVRSTALKGLTESLMVAFDSKTEQKGTDAEQASQLASMIEKELYMVTATPGQSGCGKDYKAKYRSLFFNLKDKNNESLRARVLSGELEPHGLVRLTPEELANPELQSIAEEVRKRSIHDSVLTIEQEPFIKKTHKGDVSYIPGHSMSSMSAAPDIEPNGGKEQDTEPKTNSTKGTPEEKTVEEMIQEKQSSNKSTPSGSPTTEALDKLLARIQTNKRSGEDILNDALSGGKRQRQVETGQDGSSYLPREPSPYSPSPSPSGSPVIVSTTPPDSPPPFMLEEIERSLKNKADSSTKQVLPVWQGTVEMDQVAKVFTRAIQVGGSRVIPGRVSTNPTADMVAAGWTDILTKNVIIEGRIPVKAVETYIAQQRQSVTKEVLIVRFELNSAPTGSFEQRKAEFEKLFRYFHEKSRNGVVPNKARQVKDMYLVPVGANDPVPQYFQGLVENEALVHGREPRKDALFGVLVVNKASSHHHRHGHGHGHGHSPSHLKSSSSTHRHSSTANSRPYPAHHDRRDSKDSQSGGHTSVSHPAPAHPQAPVVVQQHSAAPAPPAPVPPPIPVPIKPPGLEQLQGLVDQLFHSGKPPVPVPTASPNATQGLTPAAAAVTAQLSSATASSLIAGLPVSMTMNLTQAMAQFNQHQQQQQPQPQPQSQPQPQQLQPQPQPQPQPQGQQQQGQQPYFARPPPPPPGMPIPPPGFPPIPLHLIPQLGQRPIPPMPPIPPHQLQAFLAQQYGQQAAPQAPPMPPLPPFPPGFHPPPSMPHGQITHQQYQQQQPQQSFPSQSQGQFRPEDPRRRREWS